MGAPKGLPFGSCDERCGNVESPAHRLVGLIRTRNFPEGSHDDIDDIREKINNLETEAKQYQADEKSNVAEI